jgi:hypothetical protein
MGKRIWMVGGLHWWFAKLSWGWHRDMSLKRPIVGREGEWVEELREDEYGVA